MSAKLHRYNPLRLLESVPFGIVLMAVITLYMAAGSGRQWLRSTGVDQLPVIRDWFDKTDLEFFNSWPLKTLMALLVVNLVVVTWRKIPLTPPRYGVWCVHAGIITLVLGAALHYSNKLEGRLRLYTDVSYGPTFATEYYDKDERALYVRTGKDVPATYPLPALPRYQQYDESAGNAASLARRGLSDRPLELTVADKDGKAVKESLAELVGLKGDLRVDVIGYYPYADVRTDFDVPDPASKTTGVELSMSDPRDAGMMSDWYVVGSDPRFRTDTDHLMEVTHLEGDGEVATKVAEAAGQIFRLDVAVGTDKPLPIYVHIGATYPIGKTGYTLKIESYNPAWPMFGTHEPVQAMTMLVSAPAQQFRRMVLVGKTVQTDFKLNAPGAGAMGKRQTAPLDDVLKVGFQVQDPFGLLPTEKAVKHTLLTPTSSPELVDVEVTRAAEASVHRFAKGSGDILLAPPTADDMGGTPDAPAPEAAEHPALRIHLERHDHLDPQDHVRVVPPSKREPQADEDGLYQAVRLRVRMGPWSKEVVAPYNPIAGDRLKTDTWRGGFVSLPGAVAPLQFQLGNTRRPLPARLTLDNFKVIPFPGAPDSPDTPFNQDYRSTVTMSGADDAETQTDVAHLNHPIYFDRDRWLFFQAAYDPNVPHTWTQLGVGNRPAVATMQAGCVMIFVGLLYAFYAKPIIIRRMKQKALDAAAERGVKPKVPDDAELVNS